MDEPTEAGEKETGGSNVPPLARLYRTIWRDFILSIFGFDAFCAWLSPFPLSSVHFHFTNYRAPLFAPLTITVI